MTDLLRHLTTFSPSSSSVCLVVRALSVVCVPCAAGLVRCRRFCAVLVLPAWLLLFALLCCLSCLLPFGCRPLCWCSLLLPVLLAAALPAFALPLPLLF